MKKLKFLLYPFMALFMTIVMAGCSDDSDSTQTPDETDPTVEQDWHFDIWVALDRHGGMGRDVQTLVCSVSSLDADQSDITFKSNGIEVNETLSLESIYKGSYYYQVPVSADRFGKYKIKDNQITSVAARPFSKNTYSTRKYTHAWLDDNTLLIMAANGDANAIIWTKLNTDDMTIIDEDTLDLPLPDDAYCFTTSGILTYRAADDKLFYFYYGKSKGTAMTSKRVGDMMVAVINPTTMAVESNTSCFMDCEMVGSAYGELLQKCTFVSDDNDLYIATVSDTDDGGEQGHLLKIPANSTTFDESYDGFNASGKLLSVIYLEGNEVMAYARHDELGTGIDSYSHYYAVIDIQTKVATPVTYNGSLLPYGSGRFSSRMAYVNGNVYLGVEEEGVLPQIYIYNVETGTTTLGAKFDDQYYFEQIRVLED